MTEKYRTVNPEVLYSDDTITLVDRSNMTLFRRQAAQNSRKRVRLCAHAGPDDRLHEMLIVLERGAYVRPHKHLEKTESAHIIEGLVDVVLFENDGTIGRVLSMGDYASGKTFYYRMAAPVFHMLIIRSDVLVFHETTNGPLERKHTVFAPWAPEEGDPDAVAAFVAGLNRQIENLSANSEGRKNG